jgi:anti-sigma B factor antagonist
MLANEHRVLVVGDLDCDSAPKLQSALDPLIADLSLTAIVLDCQNLTFVDSHGFRVLLTAQQLLESQGRQLRVQHLSPAMRRTFDLVGVTGVLRAGRAS